MILSPLDFAVYISQTQRQPLCSLALETPRYVWGPVSEAGFFLQVNSWMVSSAGEGGSVGDGILASLCEE